MTSREIVRALVQAKSCPERMGLFEDFWDDTQAAWELEGLPKGVDLHDFFNYDLQFIDPDGLNTEALVDARHKVAEDDNTYTEVNGWGARMRYWKNKPGTPEHLSFDLTNEAVWRGKYREPLLGFDIRRLGNLETKRANYRKVMASGRFAVWTNLLHFEIMRKAMGDIIMLEAMCLNPAWIRDFCDVVTENIIRHLDALFTQVGLPDGMWLFEDMGYTQGPFVSPAMYRDLILPYHTRVIDFVHRHGIPVIMHACGKVAPLLPYIEQSGIDCLEVLEAKAGQHVVAMAESIRRRIAFMGNLDIRAFESNDPKLLDAEIIPKLAAIRDKRIPFVFHSDHSMPRTVHLRTYEYALGLFKQHGRY
jgi:uroporphyrinogen decarboxylase